MSEGSGGPTLPARGVLLLSLLLGCTGKGADDSSGGGGGTTSDDVPGDCAALGDFGGSVVDVTPADDLASVLAGVTSGTTVRLGAGTYTLSAGGATATLEIGVEGTVLRGATGDPADVVLDGGYATSTLIDVHASHVLIADLTVTQAYGDAIHVTGDGAADTSGTTVFNVVGADNFGSAVQIDATRGSYADGGVVACSRFSFSSEARTAAGAGCDPSGIDAVQARGWSVRDNDLSGFWCDNATSRPAIRFATGSADTVIERNRVRESGTGISLGDTSYAADEPRPYDDEPCTDGYEIGHFGGIVRNNMISALDASLVASGHLGTGIAYSEVCEGAGFHNSVLLDPAARSSEEWRGDQTVITLLNDLLSEPPSSAGGSVTINGQVTSAASDWFVDAAAGDLHLVAGSAAEDAGALVEPGSCDTDFDRAPRAERPDVGADEL